MIEQRNITGQQRLIMESDTYAEQQYSDVLTLLAYHGYSAALANTGGGCLAIEIPRENGQLLLVTSNQGPLPDERDELSCWGIGVYDADDLSEPISYQAVHDKAPQAVIAALWSIR